MDEKEINQDIAELKELLSLSIQQTDARNTNVTEKFYQLSVELDRKDTKRWYWLYGVVGSITLMIVATWFTLWVSNHNAIHEVDKQVAIILEKIGELSKDFTEHLAEHKKKKEETQRQKALW
jgi:hypothetical protein